MPWRSTWQPTPVLLPRVSHGQRSPADGLQFIGFQRVGHNRSDVTHIHIHEMKYYSATKKNEILLLTTTWMDLEGIMLKEMSQTEKDKYCMSSLYMKSKI